MDNQNIYALLIGVGSYGQMNAPDLPSCKMDTLMLGDAMHSRLRVPYENIRVLGKNGNGFVSTRDLARAVRNYKVKLGFQDTFLLYFSGHGRDKSLVLSDGLVDLQSVVDYIESLPAKNKIVILDCCFSGDFKTAGAREMHFEDSLADFAGKGMAVFASSSEDEVSRLGYDGKVSLFTGALATAIKRKTKARKGKLLLTDIAETTRQIMDAWNEQNPGREQHPVFRSSMGGTILFDAGDENAYHTKEISYETGRYNVVKVEPLSSREMKRLCAFVLLKGEAEDADLAEFTKEIAVQIRFEEVHSTAANEQKFRGKPARAVWCYFGHDMDDIINHLHCAYTIWADSRELRQTYFKENKNASVLDDIYVFHNTSYKALKKMQKPAMDSEQYKAECHRLLAEIVTKAEQFISDMQEVENRMLFPEKMQEEYKEWISSVRKIYLELTEVDVAPAELHDWSEEILNLAGWVIDMALLLENEKNSHVITDRGQWLICNATRHYYESMEKLKEMSSD